MLSKWAHNGRLELPEEIAELQVFRFGLAIAEPSCRVSNKQDGLKVGELTTSMKLSRQEQGPDHRLTEWRTCQWSARGF